MHLIDSAFAFCYRNFNRLAPTAKQLSDAVAQKRYNTSISDRTVDNLEKIFNRTLLPGTYASVMGTAHQIRLTHGVISAMEEGEAKRDLGSLMRAMEQRVNSEREKLDLKTRLTNVLHTLL